MKLLLDQGLPRTAAVLLNEMGIDTVHVGEIGYSTASDSAVLLKARDEGHIVVTLDADFHTLLALSGIASPSVIRLRVEGLRGKEAAGLIKAVLTQCSKELVHGALVTVQPRRTRIHLLPLEH
jgi:predicted nuclease of predicted toxin-antitoxin system